MAEAVEIADLRAKYAERGLSALNLEERIRILRHLGAEVYGDDEYGHILSVIDELPSSWIDEQCIIKYPDMDGKGEDFRFPVIRERSMFVRECYHELYKVLINKRNDRPHTRI